jgi:hypothetical protein
MSSFISFERSVVVIDGRKFFSWLLTITVFCKGTF